MSSDDPLGHPASPPAFWAMQPVVPTPPSETQPTLAIPQALVPAQPEAVMLVLGDITVSPHWVVTPNGTAPLQGSQWFVTDQSVTQTRIPVWAIVCAVVCALACLLGLLFLLVKERYTTGYVQVSLRSGTVMHSVQLPVTSPYDVVAIRQQVAQVQSWSAMA